MLHSQERRLKRWNGRTFWTRDLHSNLVNDHTTFSPLKSWNDQEGGWEVSLDSHRPPVQEQPRLPSSPRKLVYQLPRVLGHPPACLHQTGVLAASLLGVHWGISLLQRDDRASRRQSREMHPQTLVSQVFPIFRHLATSLHRTPIDHHRESLRMAALSKEGTFSTDLALRPPLISLMSSIRLAWLAVEMFLVLQHLNPKSVACPSVLHDHALRRLRRYTGHQAD